MLPRLTQQTLRLAGMRHDAQADFCVTPEIIRSQREVDFVHMWKLAHENKWYHIQLDDLSILQFQSKPSPSFHYIECPLDIPTKKEFFDDLGVDYRARYEHMYADQYDMVVDTADLKKYITPIRYDYDAKSYRAGVHPAGHLHIGLANQIRIAVQREMNPFAFLLFILRQRYPIGWEKLLDSPMAQGLTRHIRSSLVAMGENVWKEKDEFEIFLF